MSKITYIDNLKVVFAVLVVLHHTVMACYPANSFVASLIADVSRTFLAGFFFFLSGYFTGLAVDKKSTTAWLTGRLLKLGIPLSISVILLSVTSFNIPGERDVVKFLSLLLLADLLIVVCPLPFATKELQIPLPRTILLFAMGMGIVYFLISAAVPGVPEMGACFQGLAVFILGRIAFENNWLGFLPYRTGKRLGWEVVLLLLVSPVFGWMHTNFTGDFHWQLLIVSVWKQMMMFSLIVALLSFGKKYLDKAVIFAKVGTWGTYILFIVHPFVIALLLTSIGSQIADPQIKQLIIAPLAVGGSAGLAFVLAKLPVIRKRI